MYCKNCGSEVSPNEKYCSSCGCQITEEVSPVTGDPIDSKSEVNKKSSGLKKSSKIIIASVLAVVLLSGIAAASFRLGSKTANKPEENDDSVSTSDSDNVSSQNGSQNPNGIRTFNSLLEDDNYWVPVKIEHVRQFSQEFAPDTEDLIYGYEYDWHENEVTIKTTCNRPEQGSISYIVAFDDNGKVLSVKWRDANNTETTDTFEYENGLLSNACGMEFNRDSNGKITNLFGSQQKVEFKYTSENECSMRVIGDSDPLFLVEYKYDNNDGINLNLSNFEIFDEKWAEDRNLATLDEPYPIICFDFNNAGMLTRFSTNVRSTEHEDNYSYKTTENGYYSEYKISNSFGTNTYKIYWERGSKTQERTGLYSVYTGVLFDIFYSDIPESLLYLSYLFAAGESVF